MAKINPASEALLHAAVNQVAHLITEALNELSNAQKSINRFRKLAEGMNEFASTLEAPDGLKDTPGLVADNDLMKNAEGHVWDAMEAVLSALEPDEEVLKEMTGGDDEAISEFQNIILENRAKLAEKRAAALAS